MKKTLRLVLTAVAVIAALVSVKLLTELYDEKLKKVYFDV